jgi:ABC-type sulfate/molybdate transport systems ATPase subunit
MNLLTVSGIRFEEEQHIVLDAITFSQQEFRKIAIAGETGSGKSTLLQIIAGLVQPDAGLVLFDNKRVRGPAEELVPGHPHIAYLSQQFELQPFLRVEQVLRYANKLTAQEAATLYEVCRIGHLLTRKTSQLSGGERQRIALARLLLSRPRLLLLDEPFSNLDMAHKSLLKSVIRQISEQLQLTCMLISHDPQDTLSWADEILVLQAGRVVQHGSPALIYRQPADAYVAALFGTGNLVRADRAAALFCRPAPGSDKNNMLIRPEDFRFEASAGQGIPGKVIRVHYFGSYYETEVLLDGQVMTVKTCANHHHPGEQVYLSLAREGGWYL